MNRYVLISCVNKKLDHPAQAKDLYTSALFKMSYQYAKSLNPNAIFILSAKYGLLRNYEVISPYDETLNDMKVKDIKIWSERVLEELNKRTDLQQDYFHFLAGFKYRKYLLPHIKNYEIPMQGLRIGEQLSWLKHRVEHEHLS